MSTKFETIAAGMAAEIAKLDREGKGAGPEREREWHALAGHLYDARRTRAENEATVEKWIDAAKKQAAR